MIVIILAEYSASCLVWAKDAGSLIGRMHDADVVHGDLTTSNIMVNSTLQLRSYAPFDNPTRGLNAKRVAIHSSILLHFGRSEKQITKRC